MPSSDREVFDYLTRDDTTSFEVNLLTFATFANEKAFWFRHFSERYNREPTQVEIDAWIADITDHRFQQMKNEATAFFDLAARNYLRAEIEEGRKKILESEIVRRVTDAGSFRKQLGVSLATAIIAPIVIGVVIAAVLTYNRVFPTLISFPEQLRYQDLGEPR